MSQVSFLLQYFRRPWMIAPIVEALRSCSEVATELVVNVDSPGDNQVRGEGEGAGLEGEGSPQSWRGLT